MSETKVRAVKAKRKAEILKHLDSISDDVMAAVQVEPHGIKSKDKWVSRLQDLATQYDDILGPIAGYVKRISYKIEDSTFDHETLGIAPYCCDQVKEDLAFLKLCILPIVAKELCWDSATTEKEEKHLLGNIWASFQEVGPILTGEPYEEYAARNVEQWYSEWKSYEFRIRPSTNLAMASYVNHERKAVRPEP
jgi:hypothetical protein